MKVFVYGDSISMQYGFPLDELLNQIGITYNRLGNKNSQDLANPKFNGFSTREMLGWVKDIGVMENTVLVFNCGLHDIVRNNNDSECQVTIEEYKSNLEKIVAQARIKFDGMMFCNSTPVDDIRHNRGITNRFRYNNDILNYNSVANMIMESENIPVIDLFSLTTEKQTKEEIYVDHIHMKESISRIHAERILNELTKNGYIDG